MHSTSDGKKQLDKSKLGAVAAPSKGTEGTPPSPDRLEGLDASSHNNIEKIRTILFGHQMRDYEARFAGLEEQMAKDAAELRADCRRRLDAIESFVRQEIDAINDRLSREHGTREQAQSTLQLGLEELNKALDKRTHALEEQLGKAGRELRQQTLTQGKQLRDELQASVGELSALIERELRLLRGSKTDRAALATMLAEVATRLSSDG